MTHRRKEQDPNLKSALLLTSALPYTLISVPSSPATPPTPQRLTTVGLCGPESEAPQLLSGGGKLWHSPSCPPHLEFLEHLPVLQRLPVTQSTNIVSFIYETFSLVVCTILCPLTRSNCCLSFPQGREKVWSDDWRSSLEIGRPCRLGKMTLTLWETGVSSALGEWTESSSSVQRGTSSVAGPSCR